MSTQLRLQIMCNTREPGDEATLVVYQVLQCCSGVIIVLSTLYNYVYLTSTRIYTDTTDVNFDPLISKGGHFRPPDNVFVGVVSRLRGFRRFETQRLGHHRC